MADQYSAWVTNQGDQVLRYDYDLNQDSLVFDLGGYLGEWTYNIYEKYACMIHIFEPATEYADHIDRRFEGNPKIITHRFGLASENRIENMAILGDGSSIFKQGEKSQDIKLVRAMDFFNDNDIHKIDLIKINIEGCEYELLEHLINDDFVENIQDIQLQFHNFIPNALIRMHNIQDALSRTHIPVYQYEFIWESWRKK